MNHAQKRAAYYCAKTGGRDLYLVELKYAKKEAKDSDIDGLFNQACEQLKQYSEGGDLQAEMKRRGPNSVLAWVIRSGITMRALSIFIAIIICEKCKNIELFADYNYFCA